MNLAYFSKVNFFIFLTNISLSFEVHWMLVKFVDKRWYFIKEIFTLPHNECSYERLIVVERIVILDGISK